jgi:hypothetical protein
MTNPAPLLRRFVALLCAAASCVSSSTSAADLSDRQFVEQLVAQADSGDPASALVQSAGERGIAAALLCADHLDERKPQRSRILYEAIAVAANCRRSHAEVLRLYHPAAFRLFHTTDGLADQRRIAAGLAWKEWPASMPEALVRAAPLPTLDWLQAQAASNAPALDKLRLLWRPLGWWLRTHNERQHTRGFHDMIAAFTSNPVITRDGPTRAALLQLIADAAADNSLAFVIQQLGAEQPEARAAAVGALGQWCGSHQHEVGAGNEHAPAEFIRLAREEKEPAVLLKLAAAAEAWPEDARLGEAMMELFIRWSAATSHRAILCRAILFSVAKTRWPQRGQIILRAFDTPDDGVMGVALQAVAAHPLAELAPRTLALLDAYQDAQPHLIDAVGALADPKATPQLLRWLERERNVAVRLKLALALEKIPGEASGRALSDLLSHEAEPLLAEHLCRIASRRELPGAAAVLAALAEDATAPMIIRGQAVWALGRYEEPAARECLARLAREPEKYFSTPDGRDSEPESPELARLSITLARLRLGAAGMESEVSRRFEEATPAARLTCLLALAEMKRDHPVIASALETGDFAVLLGAVKAAGAAAPAKYHQRLRALRQAPFVASLLESGLDTWQLPAALDQAIREGEKRLPSKIP